MEQQRLKAGAQYCPSRQAYQPQQFPQAIPSPNYYDCSNYNNTMWSPPNYQQQMKQEAAPNDLYNCATSHRVAPSEQFIDISPPSSVINSMVEMCQLAANKSPMAVLSPFDMSPMPPTNAANLDGSLDGKEGSKLAKEIESGKATSADIGIEELPDELCDFILTYSRHYAGKNEIAISEERSSPGLVSNESSGGQRSSTCTPSAVSSGYETASNDGRSPGSVADSSTAGDLLFSPSSAFYTNSPNAYSPHDGKDLKSPGGHLEEFEKQSVSNARQRLRDRIEQKDLDAALAWAMRCCQSRPEALFFRDKDGDRYEICLFILLIRFYD